MWVCSVGVKMVRIMMVTFVFLGWSWYELSGGRDFVPGGNGVPVMAEAGAAVRTVPPEQPRLAGLRPMPSMAIQPELAPREISLQDRQPLTAKTVNVALKITEGDTLARTQGTKAASAPVDEIAFALAGVLPEVSVGFDTSAPVQRIAGLGAALPLGAPMGDALVPEGPGDVRDLRVVSGSRVNLRGGPATSYTALTQLTDGDKVEVLDDTGDGWVRLRVVTTETEGWMSEDFLIASN